MEVQVIDNFLNSYHFSLIESRMMGKNFPWFYGGEIVDDETEGYDPNMFQFIHHFLNPYEKFELSKFAFHFKISKAHTPAK